MKCLLPLLFDDYNSRAFSAEKPRITQAVLAEKTGIAKSTISRLYTGSAKRIDFSTTASLCEFFNCGVGDLFTLVEDERTTTEDVAA